LFIRIANRDIESTHISALQDISLDINKGDIYGVVGRNGAGKSTLLKVLSKIILPTKGRVMIWGEAVSLLGVGAGFHMELTGRENVYLYSSLLGRSRRKILDLMDEIIDFAEIGDFFDAPIRIYSSGMTARLGFSVAMAERPDILLVDEVLGVGDEGFKLKCKNRFDEFREAGSTIVIVSHGLNMIKSFCNKVVWLHRGKIRAMGEPKDTINKYQRFHKALREKRKNALGKNKVGLTKHNSPK
jgi:ABC-type polysaccharide/polyol phosphate transport system ATPase subunit